MSAFVFRMLAALWLVVLAAPIHAATVEYIHTDALGSPVAVTNSAGQVIERREYEPYGRQLAPATLSNGPGYTGHVADAATGLNYMQQRYYDPMIGRFLSVDPVTAYSSLGANFNRYWYANNSPYKFTDPDGRCARTTGSMICEKAREFKATDINLVHTDRSTNANGGSSEKYRTIQPGTGEHKSELGKLSENSREKVADRVNDLGDKLESGTDGAIVQLFNYMKVGIEVNPSTARGAGYAAKGIFGFGMLINPGRLFGKNIFRQNHEVAHEFRHLQLVNYMKVIEGNGNYNPYSSPAEKDARDYAEKLFPVGP